MTAFTALMLYTSPGWNSQLPPDDIVAGFRIAINANFPDPRLEDDEDEFIVVGQLVILHARLRVALLGIPGFDRLPSSLIRYCD